MIDPEPPELSIAGEVLDVAYERIEEAVIKVVKGKAREVHPLLWLTAAMFILYFAIDPFKRLIGAE